MSANLSCIREKPARLKLLFYHILPPFKRALWGYFVGVFAWTTAFGWEECHPAPDSFPVDPSHVRAQCVCRV